MNQSALQCRPRLVWPHAAVILAMALAAATGCGGGSSGNGHANASAPPEVSGGAAEARLSGLADLPLGGAVTGLFLSAGGDLFFNVQHPAPENPAPYHEAAVGVLAGVSLDAAALGATVEFRTMEGVNISFAGVQEGSVPYVYLAMSEIAGAMSDGTGHVDVDPNPCGVLYRLPIADAAGGDYNAGTPRGRGDCAPDGIANPDNILVMDDGRVLIGEDSDRHRSNMLWVWTPPAGK